MQGLKEKLQKHVSNVKGTLGKYVLNIYYNLLNILSSFSTASYIGNQYTKIDV